MASKQRSRLPMKTVQAPSPIEVLSNAFWHIFRISVSFALLSVDNTILITALLLARLQSVVDRYQRPRHDLPFYPKTVLITGIALARAWAAGGHHVVGADVADLDLPVRSGGSMSRTLLVFYRVPKDHYISRILDIIHREKVDVWVPCSPKATAIEDATARQVIESRTSCKCIAFDTDLATRFLHTDSFAQFLTERDLPVLERHQVHSRDSIHKILHRSPSKSYQIQRLGSSSNDTALLLPKRTLSRTYSEVSEIQINQDYPWILQQQSRLGEFYADILVVRGHVHAIKVRLAETQKSHWGASPVDEALATAIHRLMQSFAVKGERV
ncbi:O-methyltransferase family 3 [Penicillium waksmanii]|uniref:O-methyltransferase family 3 n=1 Tax=Penicillium waksmanii TaxID=69791 RepID=UPI002547F246|nr:O-methyltransferase family 3 [Penicillium waksmanii]KAJ5994934.1 O-methyltransferase family 3 [Penicillium waksmanii]